MRNTSEDCENERKTSSAQRTKSVLPHSQTSAFEADICLLWKKNRISCLDMWRYANDGGKKKNAVRESLLPVHVWVHVGALTFIHTQTKRGADDSNMLESRWHFTPEVIFHNLQIVKAPVPLSCKFGVIFNHLGPAWSTFVPLMSHKRFELYFDICTDINLRILLLCHILSQQPPQSNRDKSAAATSWWPHPDCEAGAWEEKRQKRKMYAFCSSLKATS